MEETGEGLLFVVGEAPDDESDADAVLENGAEVREVIEGAVIHTNHTDTREALKLGSGDVAEEPSRKLGAENFEIFAGGGGEIAEGFVFTSDDINGFLGTTTEEAALHGGGLGDGESWSWGDWSGSFDGGGFSNGGLDGWFDFWSVAGDGDGGSAAGRAVIDFQPILIKPELNFVVTVLRFGGEFQDVDFGFLAAVEIAGDNISEFGDSAGADVAFGAVFILVHKEEGVGLVEVFIKTFVDFS